MNYGIDELLDEYDFIFERLVAIKKVAVLICEKIYMPPYDGWYEIHLQSTVISVELFTADNTDYPYYFEIPLRCFFSGVDEIDKFITQERVKLDIYHKNRMESSMEK